MKNFNVDGKRIYVSASYPRKSDALVLAEKLKSEGAIIVSQWLYLDEGYKKRYDTNEERLRALTKAARRDLSDLRLADALVCITGDSLTHGGRHAELGVVLADGKPCILFGPREHVLHYCIPSELVFDKCFCECGGILYDGECLLTERHGTGAGNSGHINCPCIDKQVDHE